ncbi:MAG: hypothetical protein BalsKO_17920 [Balneolaceae bacterium]
MIKKPSMESLEPKIELDIQPIQKGIYEATSTSIEGFVAQSSSILEAIEQAIAAASQTVEN